MAKKENKKPGVAAKKPAGSQETEYPLLPLKDIVVFPHMIIPVFINEDLCLSAVDQALSEDRKIFLSAFQVQDKTGDGLDSSLEPPFDVYDTGTICTIMRTRKLSDGRMKVLVQGLSKGKITALRSRKPCPRVAVVQAQQESSEADQTLLEATIRSVREQVEKVVSLGKALSPDILMVLEDVKEPNRLADMIVSNLGLEVHEAQSILATPGIVERLQKVLSYLSREIEVYQLQARIQTKAKDEINRMQKEHFLREQMRAIRGELGESDKDETAAFWKSLDENELPEKANEEVSRQIRRLERMHQDTSEASLTRTHIETILSLPWNKKTEDRLQLRDVKEVLDDDHYGLEDIKDRILEYLAVKKLNQNAKSPILCFLGPPGVGKTSLGRSVARAMNREFCRISLGGVKDEADIRGHRKTYVGAYPGRIMQAIKTCGATNPIVMLDEIDKLNSDHRGDPSSALLEVLDPEQNKNFVDHYLGIEFDLSNVMFIANANSLQTIPAPLLDRMEIIEISGYSEKEKSIIAKQYLIPRQLADKGLESHDVQFGDDAILEIIRSYTKESGLRGFEKQIAAVCRKIARQVAETDGADSEKAKKLKLKVKPSDIHRFLGTQKFIQEFYHRKPVAGVSLGLAYTNVGGEVLAIEVNVVKSGESKLVMTGRLGEVMKESATTAWGFIKANCESFGIMPERLKQLDLHIHVPAGGVPKDGPSAGIAICSAILSALMGTPPAETTAMTGEITLLGKVLPIGGVKEKVLAAVRAKLSSVILPEANRPNWDELDDHIKGQIDVQFVADYIEVFETLFEDGPAGLIQQPGAARPKIAS